MLLVYVEGLSYREAAEMLSDADRHRDEPARRGEIDAWPSCGGRRRRRPTLRRAKMAE